MIVATVKTAARAYSAASSAVHIVKHPIQTTQDAIRRGLVSAAVKVVLPLAGARAVQELTSRLTLEKSFQVEFEVPSRLKAMAFDEDALHFLNTLANDAMAAPLAALGLSVGEMLVRQIPDTQKLEIQGVFRLLATSETGQLGGQLQVPLPQTASALPAP